jgi:hypothetical protein
VELDYYRGFECEPEINFISEERDKVISQIKIWIGYFNQLMEISEPNASTGKWESLALHFHLDTGWYEEEKWKLPDIPESVTFFEELEADSLEEPIPEIRNSIVSLLSEAIKKDHIIYINYF